MRYFSRKPFLALLVSMTLAAFLPLLLNNFFYIRYRNTVLEQQEALAEESLRFSVQQIDRTLLELMTQAMRLEDELSQVEIPPQETLDASMRMELFTLSARLREELQQGSEYLSTLYIYSVSTGQAAGTAASYNDEMLYERFYQPIGVSREKMDALHVTLTYASLIPLANDNMAFVRTIRRSGGTPVMQLVFLLKSSFYTTLIDKGNVENGLFILLQNDQILALSNKTGLEITDDVLSSIAAAEAGENILLDGENALLYTLQSSVGGYQVKAVIPYHLLLRKSRELQLYYIIFFSASVLLGILLIIFLSRRNALPIRQLIDYIRDHYGPHSPNSLGLEQIKDAVDALLDQRRTAQEQIVEYEALIDRSRLLEMLRGNLREHGVASIPSECRYTVVCFSAQSAPENAFRSITQSQQVLPEDCFCRSVVLDGTIVEILGMESADFSEQKAEDFLTAQIEWLDNQPGPSFSAAFSAIHQGTSSLERAYGEACMAKAFAQIRPDDSILTSFSHCEFKASSFLRDWHHLDKQLLFSTLVGKCQFEEASQLLSSLFPAEFLEEYFPESDITSLHLASLKYQFLHDIDSLCDSRNISEEQWGRLLQEILYCKNHRSLYQLMERILADRAQNTSAGSDLSEAGRIGEIRQYIEYHYADPLLNVSSIAETFGMSSNSLSQLFSRKADQGVLDYIHQVRMEKATQLLRNSQNLTIQDIASRVGYTSILTFNRKFKAAYRQTPSEYRRSAGDPPAHS